jgi:hypothetical protein
MCILDLVFSTYLSAQIFNYEVSLRKSLFKPAPGIANSHRIDMLYACLLSAKAQVDHYLTPPISDFFGFSLIELSHLGQSFATLLRLALVEEAGWDLEYVRGSAIPIEYFHRVIARFEEVGNLLDTNQRPGCKPSCPTHIARALSRVKTWYEGKISAESEQNPHHQGATLGMEDVMISDQLDCTDDAYWLELTGDFSFLQ